MPEEGTPRHNSPTSSGRATYSAPTLVVYGSLAAITRAVGNTSNMDGGGAPMVMKSQP